MESKPMTVGDVRASIKDLPDDMPLYMDDEHDCIQILNIQKKILRIWGEDGEEDDDRTYDHCLVFGIS